MFIDGGIAMKRIIALSAMVAICTLHAATASAQANIALQGIGLKAGLVAPDNVDATFGFGLVFDLGTVHPQFALESYAGYWSQSEERTVSKPASPTTRWAAR
jgi:hypothetical protein